jgi:type II secretory pathway pseudopilin PulG
MDFFKQNFIVDVVRARKKIPELENRILAIESTLREQNEVINKAAKASEESKKSAEIFSAKLGLPSTPHENEKLGDKKTTPFDWIQLSINVAALFILGAYTAVTAFQWLATTNAVTQATEAVTQAKTANADARTRFVEDQRPIVWPTTLDLPQLVPNQKLAWTFSYADYGKSPAVAVQVEAQVVFGDPSKRFLKAEQHVFRQLHTDNTKNVGSVLPPAGLGIGLLPNSPGQHISTITGFSTAFSDKAAKSEDINYILQHDGAAMVFIHFEYFDSSGNMYSSEFCRFRLSSGLTASCTIHNKIN